MNKNIKALWVSALRSGEYTKGSGALCRNDRESGQLCFCALGVLCNLWMVTRGAMLMEEDGWQHSRDSVTMYTMDDCMGTLPFRVRAWAELPDMDPRITWTDKHGVFHTDSISDINDCRGLNFNEIADIIETAL